MIRKGGNRMRQAGKEGTTQTRTHTNTHAQKQEITQGGKDF